MDGVQAKRLIKGECMRDDRAHPACAFCGAKRPLPKARDQGATCICDARKQEECAKCEQRRRPLPKHDFEKTETGDLKKSVGLARLE